MRFEDCYYRSEVGMLSEVQEGEKEEPQRPEGTGRIEGKA